MQTISRTSFAPIQRHAGNQYFFIGIPTSSRTAHREYKYIVNFLTDNKYKILKVEVLAKRLRGTDDLHGKPYQPSEFIYTIPALTDEHRKELEEWQQKPWTTIAI